jgi:hypothetical protein
MFTTTAKNNALDGLTITQASLHSAFPGATGVNELSGGGYARVAATFSAATGGTRSLSAGINFTVGAGSTVRWAGLWNNAVFIGYAANGGTPKEFIVSVATDTVNCLAHGYVDTNKVVFYGDTVPGGLVEGTVYFVRDATVDTFKVAATSGGAAIDLTSPGGSACAVSSIIEETYGAGGTHTVNTWILGLPN